MVLNVRVLKFWPLVPLSIAVVVVGFLLISPIGADCQKYNAKAQNKVFAECVQDSSAEGVAEYTKVLAALTIVLAVVGVFQMFYLIRSDDTATRAASLSEQSMISAQRAYVFAEGYRSYAETVPRTKGYHWRFRPIWRNSGDTPPINLVTYSECEIRTAPLPLNYQFPVDQSRVGKGAGTMSAKGTTQGGQAPLQPPNSPTTAISSRDLADVQAGRKILYLWGWAAYNDVFSGTKRHLTHFCYACVPVGDPNIKDLNAIRWDYIQDTQGNYFRDL